MKPAKMPPSSPRREFLGTLAAGAAIGISAMALPINLTAEPGKLPEDDPAQLFNNIKGSHRIVFDVTQPHEIFPFAWPKVFLMTNQKTGSPSSDVGILVVLRHAAIPYAMQDPLWAKYKFGKMFNAPDPQTKEPAERNPFYKTQPGAFKIPGFGEIEIGIDQLQKDGVLFCVCDAAMTVYSAVAAQNMNMDASAVKQEWQAGLIPGIHVVPSGVWAIGRAQEHRCGYCFAS